MICLGTAYKTTDFVSPTFKKKDIHNTSPRLIGKTRMTEPLLKLENKREILDSWLNNDTISNEDKFVLRKNLISILSYSLGGLASLVLYPLSESFGEGFPPRLGIENEKLRTDLGLYFGTTAVATGTILVARMAEKLLKDLLVPHSEMSKLIRESHSSLSIETMAKYLSLLCACVSAMPEANLSYQFFKESCGSWALAFSGATVIVLSAKNNFGMQKVSSVLIGPCYEKYKDKSLTDEQLEIKSKQEQILTKLKKSILVLSKLPEETIDSLLSDITNPNISFSYKVKLLVQESKLPDKIPSSQLANIGKNVFSFAGATFGALSSVAFFPLGKAAGTQLVKTFGEEDPETIDYISNVFGLGALSFRGILNVYANKDSFEKYYQSALETGSKINNSLFNPLPKTNETSLFNTNQSEKLKSFLLNSLGAFVAILSLSGGATRSAMYSKAFPDEDQWYSNFLLAAAFIGGSSLYYWALKGFANDMTAKKNNRTRVKGIIENVMAQVPSMNSDTINIFYDDMNFHSSSASNA